MVSLIVHAVLGLLVIAFIVKLNPAVFRKPADGPAFSALESAYYVIGIASIALGYYPGFFVEVDGARTCGGVRGEGGFLRPRGVVG
ncbi:hypothetical protein NCCNTM_40340 [Mycolicibacterium sp. NCC-Tsukiji]|nr:hypothetical protein NCCNTM_40340 [Mycolicibacterium sp. NCC-Tsukiji]